MTEYFLNDSFSRNVNPGWGDIESGGSWLGNGSLVDGTHGALIVSSTGTGGEIKAWAPIYILEGQLTAAVEINKTPVGGSIYGYVGFRFIDNQNYYRVGAEIAPGGTLNFHIQKVVGGVAIDLAQTTYTQDTWHPNHFMYIKVQYSGINPTKIVARLWPDSQSEPFSWQIGAFDSELALQTTGFIACDGFASPGYTSTLPINFLWDYITVTDIPTLSTPFKAFDDTSIWNVPIPETAAVHPQSNSIMNFIKGGQGTPVIVGPVTNDEFERTRTGTWDQTDTGIIYRSGIGSGSAGNISIGVDGHKGFITQTVTGSGPEPISWVGLPDLYGDVDLLAKFSIDQLVGSGQGEVTMGYKMRTSPDDRYYYFFELVFRHNQLQIQTQWVDQLGGANTKTTFQSTDLPHDSSAPVEHWIRAQTIGSNPVILNVRCWKDGDSEPSTFITNTDYANSFTDKGVAIDHSMSMVPGTVAFQATTVPTGTWKHMYDSFTVSPITSTTTNYIKLSGTGATNVNGIPIYFPTTSDTTYNIVNTGSKTMPSEFKTVRIPNGAKQQSASPNYMVVVDQDRGIVYKMVGASSTGGVWRSDGGSVFYINSNGLDGRWPQSNNVRNYDPKGIPGTMFMVRDDEVAAEVINHALKLDIALTQTNGYAYPFLSGDTGGLTSTNAFAPPEGMRLRIKRSVDLTRRGLNPTAYVIAKCLQDYGAFIHDVSATTGIIYLEGLQLEGLGDLWTTSGMVGPDSLVSIIWDDMEVMSDTTPMFVGPNLLSLNNVIFTDHNRDPMTITNSNKTELQLASGSLRTQSVVGKTPRTFGFSWKHVPGMESNTVDGLAGRNVIKEMSNGTGDMVLKYTDIDGLHQVNVVLGSYSDNLLNRFGGDFYWDVSLSLIESS